MALSRPLTALAVCMVTSAADHDRHERLAYAFRLSLSAKAVIGAERSVDILLGLLIYVAWSHQIQARVQLYQHLCLLAGMAADLEQERQPQQVGVEQTIRSELDRAILGSYFLCSFVSVQGLEKCCPMPWTDSLRRCAESVATIGETSTDRELVPLLEIARALNDMEPILHVSAETSISSARYELAAKAASHRLKALKRSYPQLASSLTFSAITVEVQYRQSEYGNSSDSATAIIECACTIKEFIDDLLSRPPAYVHQMSLVEWTCLLRVATLLVEVAEPKSRASSWETDALMSMLQPKQTLDKLYAHAASAPAGDQLAPRSEGLLRKLRELIDRLKRVLMATTIGPAKDGRFRPGNEARVAMADRPLPYQPDELPRRPETLFRGGVLEDEFWNGLTNR